MKIAILRHDLKLLTTSSFILLSGGIMAVYLLLSLLLPNYRLITTTLFLQESVLAKLSFLLLLLRGSFSAYTFTEISIMLVTGVLIGMNAALFLLKTRHQTVPEVPVMLSTQSLAGLLSTGCASCGTSLLSAISATLGIGIAPVHLLFLQLATILFLSASFLYTLQKKKYCPIPKRS